MTKRDTTTAGIPFFPSSSADTFSLDITRVGVTSVRKDQGASVAVKFDIEKTKVPAGGAGPGDEDLKIATFPLIEDDSGALFIDPANIRIRFTPPPTVDAGTATIQIEFVVPGVEIS
ncbi:hypothetical protein HB364_03665 [Pseudoflavitalea sp. X16]|uniref:hypothetical protein n=1 Tax=Paraflavitalea devenefica TaxID=2716334 RepID=UPI00141E7639|nr:hypothetical protein [Paraflavitalea devenefica]NII24158.1 hypothetical protein [Paraflavitalea devenefica]